MSFTDVFIYLAELGILESLLPFMLVFTILFAILRKSQVLGQSKPVDVGTALSIALIFVLPHLMGIYPPSRDPVTIVNMMLPYVAILLVGIVCFLFITSIFNIEVDWKIVVFILVAIELIVPESVIILAVLGKSSPGLLTWISESGIMIALIGLLAFVGLLWYVIRDDKAPETAPDTPKIP